jgi:hypothetical protein
VRLVVEAARGRDVGQARPFVQYQSARPLESENPRRSLGRHAELRTEQLAEVAAADGKLPRKPAESVMPRSFPEFDAI